MTQGTNNTVPGEKLGIKEKLKDINNKLKDFNLLTCIQEELGKDHIGDQKQLLYVFHSALSGQLPPPYRFSCAIAGYSSEGKDNLWKTINRHLPKEWYLDLTRITGASLEDDIRDYNVIYIGEGNFHSGANAHIIDQVKQLSEDGMHIIKKDVRSGYKETRDEKQERKVIIFSTTRDNCDEELTTRYSIIPVHGNPKKYCLVNKNTLEKAGDIDQQIDENERKTKPTWIQKALHLLSPVDHIDIPYASLLEKAIDSRNPRSQRDLKRLLNLIRSITYLHQKNRIKYTYRGYTVLVSTPEDLYNALEIGEDILNQSYTGLEPRLQRIIDCYHTLVQEGQTLEHDDLDINYVWVDRSQIQKRLDIKTVNTIRGHMETLANMGGLLYKVIGNRCYIALEPINQPVNNLLITHHKQDLYNAINEHWDQILLTCLTGKTQVINRSSNRLKTRLLSIETPRPINNHKNILQTHKKDSDNIVPVYFQGELTGGQTQVDTYGKQTKNNNVNTQESITLEDKKKSNNGSAASLPIDYHTKLTALHDALKRHDTDGKGVHYATLRDDKELMAHFTSEGELYRFIDDLLENKDGGICKPREGYLQLTKPGRRE